MTIGTPVALGTKVQSSSTTCALVTTANSPAGATIILFVGFLNAASTATVSDGLGNTYVGTRFGVANNFGYIFSCVAATAVPSGTTLTITLTASYLRILACAISVTGLAALDYEGAGTSATSAAPSLTTAALAQANELVVGMVWVNTGQTDTFTEDTTHGTFTSDAIAASSSALHSAWQIVSSAAAITYAPTLGTSRLWIENIKTFRGVPDTYDPRPRQFFLEI